MLAHLGSESIEGTLCDPGSVSPQRAWCTCLPTVAVNLMQLVNQSVLCENRETKVSFSLYNVKTHNIFFFQFTFDYATLFS
jgi:hypothetical protein